MKNKASRKIDRIKLCVVHGLPTVEFHEFFYSQRAEALEFAKRIESKCGSFNLRTDYPETMEVQLGNAPFFKGMTLKHLAEFMDKWKGSLTYIIHENVNDELLLFNAVVYIDSHQTLKGEINKINKTSCREAMKNFPDNLEQISVNEYSFYEKNGLVNKALLEIRKQLLDKKLWPNIIAEVAAHRNGDSIGYTYWELIRR